MIGVAGSPDGLQVIGLGLGSCATLLQVLLARPFSQQKRKTVVELPTRCSIALSACSNWTSIAL